MAPDLTNESVAWIARAIRKAEISSEEVVKFYLGRIEEVNPQLNAVVQLVADRALCEARAADAALASGRILGPLHGVPMTIKDSLDTEGVITTGGISGRERFRPAQDATVVARLRAAGAVLLGKTNTAELTLSYQTDNHVYGRTNNPYDLSRTSGGSSGGAAAITAAGGTPFDIGSDTGGSIRIPAHFCGVCGIKPTEGRVSRTGHIIPFGGFLDRLTSIGPIGRFVDDLILVLPVISGPDWRDPAIVPMPLGDPDEVDLATLRVAYHTDNGIACPTKETVGIMLRGAQALEEVVGSVEEAVPEPISETVELFSTLYDADGGAWRQRLLATARALPPDANPPPRGLAVADFSARLERWDQFRSEMLKFLESYDIIICPVNASPAVEHGRGELEAYSYTQTYSLTGWPCVVVRIGCTEGGHPIGVQIVARPWREDVALAVARHLETALGGWEPPCSMTNPRDSSLDNNSPIAYARRRSTEPSASSVHRNGAMPSFRSTPNEW